MNHFVCKFVTNSDFFFIENRYSTTYTFKRYTYKI